MSSAQASARSPTSTAVASPNVAGEPSQPRSACSFAPAMCTVGNPRRESEESIRSSWISAHAWISSRLDTACSTPSASGPAGSPPAPRQPHHANVGRKRLPPVSTNPLSASIPAATVGSVSMIRSPARPRNPASARWTLAGRSTSETGTFMPSSSPNPAAAGPPGRPDVVNQTLVASGAQNGPVSPASAKYATAPPGSRRR